MLLLQTPQKKENKMPAKKTPEKINKDDEYVGSSEAGLYRSELFFKLWVKKKNDIHVISFYIR